MFALCEGVDTLLFFLNYDFAQINENFLNYFIGILVERVCIVKPNLIEKVKKILEKCLDFDDNYFILSELLKRLDYKNQKVKINLFEFQYCILNCRQYYKKLNAQMARQVFILNVKNLNNMS